MPDAVTPVTPGTTPPPAVTAPTSAPPEPKFTFSSGATGDTSGAKADTGKESSGTGIGAGAGAEDSYEFNLPGEDEPLKVDLDAPATVPDTSAAEADASLADLKELQQSHPELYKKLKTPFSMLSRYQKAFKTPEEASALLKDVNTLAESIGAVGPDGQPVKGLSAIKNEVEAWNTVLTGLNAGDEGVIDAWLDNTDAVSKIAPRYLAKWAADKPQEWGKYFANVMVRQLQVRSGNDQKAFIDRFNALWDIPEIQASETAQALLGAMATEINQWHKIASATESKPTVPKELTDRERAVALQERKLKIQEVDGEVSKIKAGGISSAIKQMLGKVSDDLLETYTATGVNKFDALAKADPEFQRAMKETLDANEWDKFYTLLKAERRKLLPDVLKAIRKAHNLGPSKAAVKAEASSRGEAGSGAGAAPVMLRYTGKLVQGGPDPAIIDYARMKASGKKDMLMDRQFYKVGSKDIHYW